MKINLYILKKWKSISYNMIWYFFLESLKKINIIILDNIHYKYYKNKLSPIRFRLSEFWFELNPNWVGVKKKT